LVLFSNPPLPIGISDDQFDVLGPLSLVDEEDIFAMAGLNEREVNTELETALKDPKLLSKLNDILGHCGDLDKLPSDQLKTLKKKILAFDKKLLAIIAQGDDNPSKIADKWATNRLDAFKIA
jgi:hypothetical protein